MPVTTHLLRFYHTTTDLALLTRLLPALHHYVDFSSRFTTLRTATRFCHTCGYVTFTHTHTYYPCLPAAPTFTPHCTFYTLLLFWVPLSPHGCSLRLFHTAFPVPPHHVLICSAIRCYVDCVLLRVPCSYYVYPTLRYVTVEI